MPKYGIEVRIDVTKIDKARLYIGKKGKYLTMTTFIDTDNPNQYDDHGFIAHKQTKEESEAKTQTPILGNCKVFWKDTHEASQQAQQQHMPQQAPQQAPPQDDFDDDIPF